MEIKRSLSAREGLINITSILLAHLFLLAWIYLAFQFQNIWIFILSLLVFFLHQRYLSEWMHEAAHLSIDTKLVLDDVWIQAIIDDQMNITKYAITSFGEDVAETIPFWVAVRCTDRKGIKKKILKAIPNRIKFLDDFVKDNKLNTSPMVCS